MRKTRKIYKLIANQQNIILYTFPQKSEPNINTSSVDSLKLTRERR